MYILAVLKLPIGDDGDRAWKIGPQSGLSKWHRTATARHHPDRPGQGRGLPQKAHDVLALTMGTR